MKTTIKFQDQEIQLTGKLVKENVNKWDMMRNQFKVTVKTVNGSFSFDFWGYHNDWKKGKNEINLIEAFYCFIGDAISGNDSFENFCSELGYDEDSIKALKIYKECVKANKRSENLGIDLYELSNYIQEEFNV